jgi:hypothetical protein
MTARSDCYTRLLVDRRLGLGAKGGISPTSTMQMLSRAKPFYEENSSTQHLHATLLGGITRRSSLSRSAYLSRPTGKKCSLHSYILGFEVCRQVRSAPQQRPVRGMACMTGSVHAR